MKREKEQDDFTEYTIMASRLREERVRVEPKQGDFAARMGISQSKQSALESGRNDLKADYLAAIARAGIDVMYVLTGTRSPALLSEEDNGLLAAGRRLPTTHRAALLQFLDVLSGADSSG